MESREPKKIGSYRDLLVWQKAMDLVVMSCRLSKRLPASENFGLISQIQRAAVSIPTNIAEGGGRRHLGDYLHHLSIANGSLKELETLWYIVVRLAYLPAKEVDPALQTASEVGRMPAFRRRRAGTKQRMRLITGFPFMEAAN